MIGDGGEEQYSAGLARSSYGSGYGGGGGIGGGYLQVREEKRRSSSPSFYNKTFYFRDICSRDWIGLRVA